MRIRQPGMSPEKIAIAVAVTIAAIAGIGAMKNVTGTSSAVAIVAVSPGTAPTNRPNSDAPAITTIVYGSSTIENACAHAGLIEASEGFPLPGDRLQHAPRQRNAQQLVENVMDREHEDARDRHDVARPHAEHGEHGGEIHGGRHDEAEPVDEQDVEDVDAERDDEREHAPRDARPGLEAHPMHVLARAPHGESLDDEQ